MPVSPRDRLRLWDAVTGMHPVDASVRCLAVALPDLDDPAGLPLGDRDAALLALRAEVAGDRLVAHAACPGCGDQTTVELTVSALIAEMATEPEWHLDHDGRTVAVRALTSRDAATAVLAASPAEARLALVRAALGTPPHAADPDEGTAAAVAASLAEHDRGAEVLLTCTCAGCGARWEDLLDVASFVTTELRHSGARLLAEVAELARTFGWSEDAVLDLTDGRRHAYLALAAG